MNKGDLTSRELGRLAKEKSGAESSKSGDVPGTAKKQNVGHNSKKESLGQNTDQ